MQTVRVIGLKELEVKLQAIANEFGGKKAAAPIRSALRKAGNVVRDDAKRKVRVNNRSDDDGIHVRDNIIVASAKKKDLPAGRVAVNVTVRSRAKDYVNNKRNRNAGRVGGKYRDFGRMFYARFLEFGTSKMGARPFMRPAFEVNKNHLPEIIRDELGKAIERFVRKIKAH